MKVSFSGVTNTHTRSEIDGQVGNVRYGKVTAGTIDKIACRYRDIFSHRSYIKYLRTSVS